MLRKPRILTIGLPDEVANALAFKFGDLKHGWFGRPYRVQRDEKLTWIPFDANLPDLYEQEVFIVDLHRGPLLEKAPRPKQTTDDEIDWWCKKSTGEIDSRPRGAREAQTIIDRALEHNGFLVVFLDAPTSPPEQTLGLVELLRFHPAPLPATTTWSFSKLLDEFDPIPAHGSEFEWIDDEDIWSRALSRVGGAASYRTAFRTWSAGFTTLAKSKYGDSVAGLYRVDGCPKLLLLPQVADKAELLNRLVNEVLPAELPALFPDATGMRWLDSPDLESSGIASLRAKLVDLRQRFEEDTAAIHAEIDHQREATAFERRLLSETGTPLVKSVVAAFKKLGFADAVEKDDQADEGNLQQDIEVPGTPLLLIEVKGIEGLPNEKQVLQVLKYVSRTMKAEKRTDVRGLSVINAQRRIAPGHREVDKIFTSPQRSDASTNDIGLLSTVELFYMIRGVEDSRWPIEFLRSRILNGSGEIRCEPGPRVAEVVHVYDQAQVLSIETLASVRVGFRIVLRKDRLFITCRIASIQHKKVALEEAPEGETVGIKLDTAWNDLANLKGADVYLLE
jgi:hypothetical protein